MTSSNWLSMIFVALALILPLAALRSRRLPTSKYLKMGAIWIAIFALVAFAISQVHG